MLHSGFFKKGVVVVVVVVVAVVLLGFFQPANGPLRNYIHCS